MRKVLPIVAGWGLPHRDDSSGGDTDPDRIVDQQDGIGFSMFARRLMQITSMPIITAAPTARSADSCRLPAPGRSRTTAPIRAIAAANHRQGPTRSLKNGGEEHGKDGVQKAQGGCIR